MVLDRIQSGIRILRRCHRAIHRMCGNLESRSRLYDRISMTHPTDRLSRNILEYLRIPLINQYHCLAVLSDLCTSHTAAKHEHHELCAVAEPQHRYPKPEQLSGVYRCVRRITTVRSAGQDDPLGIHFLNFFNIGFVRIYLTIYITFTDAPCHELVILPAKIQYNH